MPLPPALLKRLAKRGLVDKSKKGGHERTAPAEEIIAEDYDEVDEEQPFDYDYDFQSRKKSQQNFWSERLKRRIVDGSVNGHKGCPNKVNIYHKCSLYCINTFGDGIKEPPKGYTLRKQRLLKRFPLPKNWKEIYDEGVGVHYYWNTNDDNVSWLPPFHPKSNIGKSAAALRKELEASLPDLDENEDSQPPSENVEMDNTSDSNQSNTIKELPPPSKPLQLKKPKSQNLDKALRAKDERRKKKDASEGALDPMDPAAYSDIPRGKWSAGLDTENRKTGVDSSVSGTLFQMRPYPSPGAVLQANAQRNNTDDQYNSDNVNDSDQPDDN